MTWTCTKDRDGAPVWRGCDSVYDMCFDVRTWRWMGEVAAFAIMLPASLIGAVLLPWAVWESASGGWSEPSLAPYVYGFLWLLSVGMTLALIGAIKEVWSRPRKFICRSWMLSASGDHVIYRAGDFDAPLDAGAAGRNGTAWSVRLDEIARVESGATSQWQAVRRYEGAPFNQGLREIPRMEFQAFLYLNDGSRRVIFIANGDPESVGTLAQSIRDWIETRRRTGRVKTISPAALTSAGEGFDL